MHDRQRRGWTKALGELLIIVLGVLIALGVDSWRASLSLRQTEIRYLESLVQDLEQDLVELDEATERADRNEYAARVVLDVAEGQHTPESPDSVAHAVEFAGYLYFASHSPYTFDDLTSTGNLQIIRNPELRRALAAYYNLIESEGQWHARYRGVQDAYSDLVRGALGPDIRSRLTTSEPIRATDLDRSRILTELAARSGLAPALEGMIWVQVRQRREHELLRQAAGRLLDVVQQELESR